MNDGKPFDIPTVGESVVAEYHAGKIDLHEAARIFFRHGWTNFIDEDFARRYIEVGGNMKMTAFDSIIVRFSDEPGDYMEYRRLEDGTIFDEKNFRSVDTRYTLEEIAERARTFGYTVETYTPEETEARDKARHEARENKPDYELDYGVPWGNREYRKTARESRLASRTQRRG